MKYFRILLSFGLLAISNICLGNASEIIGQAGEFQVMFDDPRNDSTYVFIQISKLDENDSYTKQIKSVSFQSECSVKSSKLLCKKNGTTPLAGATYQITNDGSPSCPGQVSEERYTCISGCKASVPRYLKINRYEC